MGILTKCFVMSKNPCEGALDRAPIIGSHFGIPDARTCQRESDPQLVCSHDHRIHNHSIFSDVARAQPSSKLTSDTVLSWACSSQYPPYDLTRREFVLMQQRLFASNCTTALTNMLESRLIRLRTSICVTSEGTSGFGKANRGRASLQSIAEGPRLKCWIPIIGCH
jgi:hypothetical protein